MGDGKNSKKLTEDRKGKIETIVNDKTSTVEELMKRIKTMENKVKFQAFGKTRKNTGQNKVKETKECTECRWLEGGPQSAGELVTQGSTDRLEGGARTVRNLEGMVSSGGLGEGPRPADELDNVDSTSKLGEVPNHAGGLDDPLRSGWLGEGRHNDRELDSETTVGMIGGESLTSRETCSLTRTGDVVKGFQPTTGLDEVSKRGLERRIEPAGGLEKEKQCEKWLTEEEKSEKLMKSQWKKTEDIVNEIKNSTKVRLARIFKMKDEIMGGKKTGQEPAAMKDPETGDIDMKPGKLQFEKRRNLNFENHKN